MVIIIIFSCSLFVISYLSNFLRMSISPINDLHLILQLYDGLVLNLHLLGNLGDLRRNNHIGGLGATVSLIVGELIEDWGKVLAVNYEVIIGYTPIIPRVPFHGLLVDHH